MTSYIYTKDIELMKKTSRISGVEIDGILIVDKTISSTNLD